MHRPGTEKSKVIFAGNSTVNKSLKMPRSTQNSKCVFEEEEHNTKHTHIHTHTVRTQIRLPWLLLIMVAKARELKTMRNSYKQNSKNWERKKMCQYCDSFMNLSMKS